MAVRPGKGNIMRRKGSAPRRAALIAILVLLLPGIQRARSLAAAPVDPVPVIPASGSTRAG